ncbi:MAG TPA: hypothetical protein PK821_07165 [Victivallales bacterium]|nr:hypothetical protein [Victivallales bacterium]
MNGKDTKAFEMTILRLVLSGTIGLLLPGYLLSRLLKIKGWELAPSTFMLSTISVFYSILILAYSPLTANFASVSAFLATLSITLLFYLRHKKIRLWEHAIESEPKTVETSVLFIAAPFAILILLRSWMQPMISPDSIFRWQHLAELVFNGASLSFYPPSTADDFLIYPYPDGFPPLASIIYSALYIYAGKIIPSLSSVIVLLQFTACLYYVYHASQTLFGRSSAAISLLSLLLSTTLFFSLFLGQETGWTAVSAAGFFYYAAKNEK